MGSLPFPISDVKTVAVIGFGISGVVSCLHLKAAGLRVTVYERSSQAGGVWVYDERRPPEPPYPATKPSVADLEVPRHEDGEKRRKCDYKSGGEDTEIGIEDEDAENVELLHAPPGPAYIGLKNNVPTPLMALKGIPWEPGTPDYTEHFVIRKYIQSAAAKHDLEKDVLYHTRVQKVWKENGKWLVRSATLVREENKRVRKRNGIKAFDAVVVASGHYHAIRVPDIPGLKKWKDKWPERVRHSKSYRNSEEYRDQTVLLIGAATSSTDIARELSPVARKVYQSSRNGAFDIPAHLLPRNASRVAGISSFEDLPLQQEQDTSSEDPNRVLGTVTLTDGTVLRDVQRVIVATGYHCSYPFLQDLHDDSAAAPEADDTTLVTDGVQMHNLHRDIFYIPDPTLAFVGVPYYSATFSLFEFQAVAVAAVYAGRADLPATEAMRREYRARVERKGYGRQFHSLREEEVAYVDELVGWVNRSGGMKGFEPIEGHTREWHDAKAAFVEMIKARGLFGSVNKG